MEAELFVVQCPQCWGRGVEEDAVTKEWAASLALADAAWTDPCPTCHGLGLVRIRAVKDDIPILETELETDDE